MCPLRLIWEPLELETGLLGGLRVSVCGFKVCSSKLRDLALDDRRVCFISRLGSLPAPTPSEDMLDLISKSLFVKL